MEYALYALIGTAAGFFAGLLGIGGGAIVGPLLILMFTDQLAFDATVATHLAIGTTLGVIAFTAAVSAATHTRLGNVHRRSAALISVGAVAGAVIGVAAAAHAPHTLLQALLAALLLFTTRRLLAHKKNNATDNNNTAPPNIAATRLLPVAVFTGIVSAVIGIGGGMITVPFLTRNKMPIKPAIGTSAVVGLPLAITATVGFIIAGNTAATANKLPENAIGFVYLPALFCIAVFAMTSATVGARLTQKLPVALLRKIFAVVTLLIAVRLLWLIA